MPFGSDLVDHTYLSETMADRWASVHWGASVLLVLAAPPLTHQALPIESGLQAALSSALPPSPSHSALDQHELPAVEVAAHFNGTMPTTIRKWYAEYVQHRPPPPSLRPRCPTHEQLHCTREGEPLGHSLGCNIVFIKIPKCASSTSSGVARRIAHHHQMQGVHDVGFIPAYLENVRAEKANHAVMFGEQPRVCKYDAHKFI